MNASVFRFNTQIIIISIQQKHKKEGNGMKRVCPPHLLSNYTKNKQVYIINMEINSDKKNFMCPK